MRPLTLAAWVPALLAVLALPVGFIEEEVAVIAGVYGLYFALPGVVAWCLDRARPRLPVLAQRVLGAAACLVVLAAITFWAWWIGPLLLLATPSAVVVVVVAVRLLRGGACASP